jgi:aldehyde dehydrogenase (NAD+)
MPVLGEVRHAARHLEKWMKPKRVGTPLALLGSRSRIVYEPKGVVLIISPWNFPINLTLGPLVSAIAAGNCAIVKPSELTPAASECMKRIVSEVFDESEVAVIEGDAFVAESLLQKRFDHIFFTGSPAVGKIVMKAAAEHLTSVTLELGGKSPAIIDRTADVGEAARKIAWGKFLNSGQVCIAPDYVLVDEAVKTPFLNAFRTAIHRNGSHLVDERHAARMKRLLDDAVGRGATVVSGGHFEERRMEPTLIADVDPDSSLMFDEIFGPILPVISYRTREDALRIIGEREKPLVLYVFSRDKAVVDRYIRETRAGGTVVNDTLLHFYQLNLPFGGVGNSGIGKAHGFFGFEAFSNARGILEQPFKRSAIELIYPPYGVLKRRFIDFMLRYL